MCILLYQWPYFARAFLHVPISYPCDFLLSGTLQTAAGGGVRAWSGCKCLFLHQISEIPTSNPACVQILNQLFASYWKYILQFFKLCSGALCPLSTVSCLKSFSCYTNIILHARNSQLWGAFSSVQYLQDYSLACFPGLFFFSHHVTHAIQVMPRVFLCSTVVFSPALFL